MRSTNFFLRINNSINRLGLLGEQKVKLLRLDSIISVENALSDTKPVGRSSIELLFET